jgi:hypothetical protein
MTMSELEKIPLEIDQAKKKLAKGLINYGGIFVSVCLMFAVIVIMTTDVKISSFRDLADLGMDFFLLLFCAYASYISCADSGTRAGLASETYNETVKQFYEWKEKIVKGSMQVRLAEFCRNYILDDLKNVRMSYLAVVGLSYEQYQKYTAMDDAEIDALTDISTVQKKAIKKCNGTKPITLKPESILRHGKGAFHRSPLEMSPEKRKNINFCIKFAQSSLIALGMSIIALDVVTDPSWVVFATVCFKLVSVIYNCFSGFRAGYSNIIIDSVDYMKAQIDLMQQAIQYIEANPIREKANETSEEITQISLDIATTTND